MCPNPWCNHPANPAHSRACPQCGTTQSREGFSLRGVLYLRHSAPFDGCHWEKNYWYLSLVIDPEDESSLRQFTPINDRSQWHPKLTPEAAMRFALKTAGWGYDPVVQRGFHDLDGYSHLRDPDFFPIDDSLSECVATPFWSTLFAIIPDKIAWKCERCNRTIRSYPPTEVAASFSGDGHGIMYQPTDFYCKRCYPLIARGDS